MKKLISAGAMILLSQLAFAEPVLESQVKTQERNVNITVNPAAFLFGFIEAGADFKVSSKTTIGGYFDFAHYGVRNSSSNGKSSSSADGTVFGGGAKMHYYLTNDALEDGWYISPSIGFIPIKTRSDRASVFNTSATLGYQWIWNSGFNMNLGFGAQYISVSADKTDTYLRGVIPAVDFKMGFAF